MKKLLLSALTLIGASSINAQLDITASGLYSSPLDQFCIDDYEDGWGAKLGIGYTSMGMNGFGVEYGFNWLVNNNGYKRFDERGNSKTPSKFNLQRKISSTTKIWFVRWKA